MKKQLTQPESFTAAGCLIRSLHKRIGGPIIGFVVLREGRVLALPYVIRTWIDAARRSAVRFAKGCYTRRDENQAAAWFAYESREGLPARPRWLAVVKGYTLLAKLSADYSTYLFPRSTGIAPRPRYGPLKPRAIVKGAAVKRPTPEPMMKFTIDKSPATSPHRPLVRAGVVRGFNAYSVPSLVTVEAFPHRPLAHARQLARRIHRDRAYLAEALRCRLPGVTVDRPAVAALQSA